MRLQWENGFLERMNTKTILPFTNLKVVFRNKSRLNVNSH